MSESHSPIEAVIRFKQGDLQCLREQLLAQSPREAFAALLAKREKCGPFTVFKVIDVVDACAEDYHERSGALINLKKEFVKRILSDAVGRFDVDTLIDVHTHPFSKGGAWFSGMDDRDEREFSSFLCDRFDDLHYGSIVFSRSSYAARLWEAGNRLPLNVRIGTQAALEIPDGFSLERTEYPHLTHTEGRFNRSTLALGVGAMRRITGTSSVTLVGMGGLGSIIAEHLVHMGFQCLNLIDPDLLEVSNLNRIVGVTHDDATAKASKVEVIARHLRAINPEIHITTYTTGIEDPEMEEVVARSDWVIVSSDTHTSRFVTQRLCLKYFVPMISAGVGITVKDGAVKDMSGEVVTVRAGDNLCLCCLGRLSPAKMAHESHPDPEIRRTLVERGYVSGADVKDPAVKTLNSMVGTMAVDVLVNQYTGRTSHRPILVYENNAGMAIYEDTESMRLRPKHCFTCSL